MDTKSYAKLDAKLHKIGRNIGRNIGRQIAQNWTQHRTQHWTQHWTQGAGGPVRHAEPTSLLKRVSLFSLRSPTCRLKPYEVGSASKPYEAQRNPMWPGALRNLLKLEILWDLEPYETWGPMGPGAL